MCSKIQCGVHLMLLYYRCKIKLITKNIKDKYPRQTIINTHFALKKLNIHTVRHKSKYAMCSAVLRIYKDKFSMLKLDFLFVCS